MSQFRIYYSEYKICWNTESGLLTTAQMLLYSRHLNVLRKFKRLESPCHVQAHETSFCDTLPPRPNIWFNSFIGDAISTKYFSPV